MDTDRTYGGRRRAAAALLVGFQSVMSFIVALALFASAHRAARWLMVGGAHRRLELAWIMLLATLVAVVVAVALASFASWGRVAALVFEAFVIVSALMRIGPTPVSAILALLIAGTVISLVVSTDGDGAGAGGATPRSGAESSTATAP
ncbi:MAG TPA: hypothetical protein VFY79_11935 [Dehalococcoidia bacterium]|jgi:hypothetical protein|nr:hypothetical protein [Dehalococcoidia bacterium]